jgi:hypothetical protein
MTKAWVKVMESPVSWAMAIVLVAAAAVHIGEEAVAGFRRFLNTEWFAGNENCPVTRRKGLLMDKIGLFVVLTGLAIAGALVDARLILVAVGFVAADLVQHAGFSIAKRGYTPGVATSALYLVYVVYLFSHAELRYLLNDPLAWVALAVGAGGIALNYWLAWTKVRRGDCRLAIA